MKKILLMCFLLLFAAPCFAVNNFDYYQDKIPEKKLKKIEKLYDKNKHEKILKIQPDFLPSILSLGDINGNNGNYEKSIYYYQKALELNKIQNLYNNDVLFINIARSYWNLKNYEETLKYLSYVNINNIDSTAMEHYNVMQAVCNTEIKNYNNSILFANKISDVKVKNVLLHDNYVYLNNFKKALESSLILLKLEPNNPEFLCEAGFLSTNKNDKLNYFKKARYIYINQQNWDKAAKCSGKIYSIEQEKINNAMKTLTVFCKKPDYQKILDETWSICENNIRYIPGGYYIYLTKRLDAFFEETNNCIKSYKGKELAACFSNINNEQEKLNQQLIQAINREKDIELQEESLNLQKQNIMLQEQRIRLQQQNNWIQQQNNWILNDIKNKTW